MPTRQLTYLEILYFVWEIHADIDEQATVIFCLSCNDHHHVTHSHALYFLNLGDMLVYYISIKITVHLKYYSQQSTNPSPVGFTKQRPFIASVFVTKEPIQARQISML